MRILVILGVIVLGLLAVIATRPATFHIERSATVPAPPDSVYARLADFHLWQAWSPWAKLDPAMQTDYSGPESGVGAGYHWVGNKAVGEGRMTITDATPPGRVAIKLDFLKPFPASNTCTFTIAPEGSGTHVTWAMDGHNSFMAKAMSLFMNMDKMIGPDFERGLASLGHVVPSAAAPAAAAPATSQP